MTWTVFHDGDELSAAVALRRLFPGSEDLDHARACARTIASWRPITPPPEPTRRAGKSPA